MHARLLSINQAAQKHDYRLHRALVAAMEFKNANKLKSERMLDVAVLPDIVGRHEEGSDILVLSGVDEMRWASLNTDKEWWVLAVVSPYCGYSRRAVEAIASDVDFAWLTSQLSLITPVGDRFSHAALHEWSLLFPENVSIVAAPGSDWHGIHLEEWPVFHLMRRDVRIDTIYGWQDGGSQLKRFAEVMRREDGNGAEPR